ncbi:leucyl aminopeptidase [Angustibacter luteus]|uniref:Probable cytosol aminopeptidase n=1 Tax=Angustibacter luteus TaxID=658456 RepID=A0ABW1JC61_9ACTN
MTSLSLSDKDVKSIKTDTLVVGVASSADGPVLVDGGVLPRALRTSLSGALAGIGVTGATDQVVRIPAGKDVAAIAIAFTGLGKAVTGRTSTYDLETLRRAAGAATRALPGTTSVAFALPAKTADAVAAVSEGALLGAYSFTRHRARTADDVKAPVSDVTVLTPLAADKAANAAASRAQEIAKAVHLVRDLVNTAPGDLPPAAFADEVVAAAKAHPVKVEVLDEKALAKGGYGGILGVGLGSSRPPRLVKITYAPRGAKKHLALIGKGITFDTGGISLKPPAGMETMKSDMAGGATVAAAVLALARLRTKVKVTAWVPLAENMPSGTAQRPSDVLTTYGGRTVEVLNTDAEGRLVLADAIVAAGEEYPDAIIDVATLTGHQVVALGHRYAAIMANDDDLRGRIHAAAERSGETMWPMPLPAELRSSMDSQVADIANMGERMGGMLVAGIFLKEFVGDRADGEGKIAWAHVDIAGPSYCETKPWGYTPKGGTGHSLRTLVEFTEEFASS